MQYPTIFKIMAPVHLLDMRIDLTILIIQAQAEDMVYEIGSGDLQEAQVICMV